MTPTQIDSLTGTELDRAVAEAFEPDPNKDLWRSINGYYVSEKGFWKARIYGNNENTTPRYNLRKDVEAIEAIRGEMEKREWSFSQIVFLRSTKVWSSAFSSDIDQYISHADYPIEAFAKAALKAIHSRKDSK